jgi:multidrug efflux pump subunit AcrA (membrane-fusion protein)
MRLRNSWVFPVVFLAGTVVALAAALFFPDALDDARVALRLAERKEKKEEKKKADDDDRDRITVSDAARANMGLWLEKVEVLKEPHWRTITVPGVVVDRPGIGERAVAAPYSGVVKKIHTTTHQRVKAGEPLFTLQIISEPLQSAQVNYRKTRVELDQAEDVLRQMKGPFESGAVPPGKWLEQQQLVQRLNVALQGLEKELESRGLSKEQIDQAAQGHYLMEVTVAAPPAPPAAEHDNGNGEYLYEMEEIKVVAGEFVAAGQALGRLADHKTLFIEGRAFAHEAALVQQAAKNGWPLQAEFVKDHANGWDTQVGNLHLHSFANRIDPETQSVTFHVVLPNTYHDESTQGGKALRLWRFRPGQKVLLHVPVEKYENVIKVPITAIARNGPESYVFRVGKDPREGETNFNRTPVNLVYEDSRFALIANDDALPMTGKYLRIAVTCAVQLNWMLEMERAKALAGDD